MSETTEQWKVIEGFYDYYISNQGRVFALKSLDFRKITTNSAGYSVLSLQSKNKEQKVCYVHKLVASAFIKNPEQKRNVDHINNHRTDNRIENLRFATHSENRKNSSPRSDSTTKVKGVYFDKKYKKFKAYIAIDGIQVHLGSFKTLDEARNVRVKKAQEVFGVYINACEKM